MISDRFGDIPKMSIELPPRTGSNSGSEILCRTDMSYVEALHLVLFHLTVVNSKKFHDVENAVVPLLRRKLKALQVKLDYTYYGFCGTMTKNVCCVSVLVGGTISNTALIIHCSQCFVEAICSCCESLIG